MILGLGMLVGPFIGGGLAEAFSLKTPFLFAGVVIIAAMAWSTASGRGQSGRGHARDHHRPGMEFLG